MNECVDEWLLLVVNARHRCPVLTVYLPLYAPQVDVAVADEPHPHFAITGYSHSGRAHRRVAVANQNVDLALTSPTQTFFVPLPENDVFFDMLRKINDLKDTAGLNFVRGNMISLISVAISTDNTVIWYDHWEDGYETDIKAKTLSKNTQIWGDGNAANGCRPGIVTCTNSSDYLNAGDSFVIENAMAIPRTSTNWFEAGIKFDGGDKLMANFPVTMTRGSYAEYPGSLLAGGVEVQDTDNWGKVFEAPIGNDVITATDAFQHVRLFIMSATDGNQIKLPNGMATVLNQGQSVSVDVKQGDKVESSANVQVFLCTGDISSNYEMRWFSLIATDVWSEEYMTPVGDSFGRTKMVLYNPNPAAITVRFTWLLDSGAESSENLTIEPRKSTFTRIIPTGSGAVVKSAVAGKNFLALSMTDTEVRAGTNSKETDNEYLGGQAFDWGFSVVPIKLLTPQVLVGWGYGCTANNCQGKTERSCVWISPVADADIYVDYQNTGSGYVKIPMKRLQSKMLRDTLDHDMSGAIVFATKTGTGPTGEPVDIAAAWGQDPAVSRQDQQISLDLGTTVLPFSTIRVKKIVDLAVASTGDILTYTITVQNVGQTEIKAGKYSIVDPAAFQGKYVAGSTEYSADGGKTKFAVPDNVAVGSTPFPLDESGLPSQRDLPRRGGVHQVIFKFEVAASLISTDTLVNKGWVKPPIGPNLPFEAVTTLTFKPAIKVENVVYLGDNGTNGCRQGLKVVTDVSAASTTYCFKVTNSGSTFIDNVQLTNKDLGFLATDFSIPKLAPGDSVMVSKSGKITKDLKNVVTVVGNPVFHGGADIPGIPDVAASDGSEVKMIAFAPQILIENTVYAGDNGPKECRVAGVEKVIVALNETVTYCFKVSNTGNTHLNAIKISDPLLNNYVKTDLVQLAPGESTVVSLPAKVADSLTNVATASGIPCLPNGDKIPSLQPVTNSDPSEVAKKVSGTVKSGGKDAFDVVKPPEGCMQTNWEDAGNTQNLVCRAKEVYLNDVTSARLSCEEGTMTKLTLNASIHFNAARYDPGWYVATDGGDALVGTCAINGLVQGTNYNVTDGKGGKTVGRVAWNADFKGGNDKCGDVLMDGGGGCDIAVPFLKDVEMKCVDENNDGNMDFSVCFSWRVAGQDGLCTLSRDDPSTVGKEADLYPGTPSKCFCARYDVPTVTVIKTSSDAHISPC